MRTLKRLIPLALLLGLLGIAWAFGLQRQLSWTSLSAHQDALHALVAEHPVMAPIAFTALYAACVTVMIPAGIVLSVASGLLFGTVLGTACDIIAATIGAAAIFLIVRYALADLVAARTGNLLARMRPGLQRDGFSYLLVLRLIPAFPFWLVNLGAALTGVAFTPFVVATALGIIPATTVFASIGAGIGGVLAAGGQPDLSTVFSPHVLGPLLGLAALSLLPVLWRHWRARQHA